MSGPRRRIIRRGLLPCKTCGKPHNCYALRDYPNAPVSWAHPKDGHTYNHTLDYEGVLSRLLERRVVTSRQVLAAYSAPPPTDTVPEP